MLCGSGQNALAVGTHCHPQSYVSSSLPTSSLTDKRISVLMESMPASTAISDSTNCFESNLDQQSVTAQSGIPFAKPRVLRRSSRSTSSHTAFSSAGKAEAQTWNQDESPSMPKRKSPVKRHQRKRPYPVVPAITGSPRPSDGGMLSRSKRAGRSQKVGPTRSKIAREPKRNIRKRHDAPSHSESRKNWPQYDQERASPPSMIGVAPVDGMPCPMARQSICLHEDWSGRQPLLMDIVLDMKDYARTRANVPQANMCYCREHLRLQEDPSAQHVVQRSSPDTFAYAYASRRGLGGTHLVSIGDPSISVCSPGKVVSCAGMNQRVPQHHCQLQQLQTSYHPYSNSDNNTPCNPGTRFPESGERSTVHWNSSSNNAQGPTHQRLFME